MTMYIERKKKPAPLKITSRPATLVRLKKSCWLKNSTDAPIKPTIGRPVVVKLARTGGVKRPLEFCMHNPPTQKTLNRVRAKLFDGLCNGQPPDVLLGRKSPSSTPQRGKKRNRAQNDLKDDLWCEEPPRKKRQAPRNPRRQPRSIRANKPPLPPGEVPKAKAPGPGYCHNCKKARDSCLVCPNVRTHRFCLNCVSRHFSEDYEIIFNQGIDCWEQRDGCPVCFWQCPCAACKRRMMNRKQKAAAAKAREIASDNYGSAQPAVNLASRYDEEEEEEADKDVASGRATEEEQLEDYEEDEEEEEMEEAEADEASGVQENEEEEEEEEAEEIVSMEAGEDEGYVDERDSEQEDEGLHDPNQEDSIENIEGHTHSEEDRKERERARKPSYLPLTAKKRCRFLVASVGSQPHAGEGWERQSLHEGDASFEGDDEGEEEEGRGYGDASFEEDEDEEEEEILEEEEDGGRHLNWVAVRIMARRQRGGKHEYFVMWQDRWLTGDDTVSMYRRGELKEILKKRKRKRHPLEYLVRRNFSWEPEDKIPQRLLDIWHNLYEKAILEQKGRGKGKGKGEGWDLLWQTEQRKRRASTSSSSSSSSAASTSLCDSE